VSLALQQEICPIHLLTEPFPFILTDKRIAVFAVNEYQGLCGMLN